MSAWDSVNFSRSEFACKCGCGFDTIDFELVETLQKIRNRLEAEMGRPIRMNITSACRCDSHNKSVGGSDGSFHKKARAADVQAEMNVGIANEEWIAVPPEVVHGMADEMDVGGLGSYDSFTHIDTRHGRSRWEG